MNPNLWDVAISMLNEYFQHKCLSSSLYDCITELLNVIGESLQNENFQDMQHLFSIIDLFYNMTYNDYKMARELISNNAHVIFYPLIQFPVALRLFNELLILDHAPNDLNQEANLPTDHDLRQIEYEAICEREGYNSVAIFCIENDISAKLLELLDSEKELVLKTIKTFGRYYFFSFESFIPVFSHIFEIVYQDQVIENRIAAIESISPFAGSSNKAQNFFLSTNEFMQLFTDYSDETPEIVAAILSCAKNIMSISEYLDEQNVQKFLDFASQYLESDDPNILNQSIKIISEGTKNGEMYVAFCMENGIIQHFFQMLDSELISFRTQTKIFIAICYFFEQSDFENAKQMVEFGFFNMLSEFLQTFSYNNVKAMRAALDALNQALQLALDYPEVQEWKQIIYGDDSIITAIEDYDCGTDQTGDYTEESIQVYAHSFLGKIEIQLPFEE